MKNIFIKLLAICLIATTFQSCFKDRCQREVTYTKLIPVYLTPDEMRVDISFENPRALNNPGKIYYYNNHIYINEIRKGIHIIDNNDPSNPVNVGFINILGNVDISIRDNVLFADNYIDLLSIDISDYTNPQILDREENVFPFEQQPDTESFLVYYDEQEVTEMFDCNTHKGGGRFNWSSQNDANGSFQSEASGNDPTLLDQNSGTQTTQVINGIAGSMARFSLIGDFLYMIDEQDMYVYDISNANDLRNTAIVNLGWGIETIFPYKEYLFIGSNTGMLIYDNTNPALPAFVSEFRHAQACDPVYVKDDYAYVTLRNGTGCWNAENIMNVVDISDIENPEQVHTVQMENPHGLSIKENDLYVCEGAFGFKTFDMTNPLAIRDNMKSHVEGIPSYDVIALPGQADVIMIIGKGGFFQYDVSDINEPRLISSILSEE